MKNKVLGGGGIEMIPGPDMMSGTSEGAYMYNMLPPQILIMTPTI